MNKEYALNILGMCERGTMYSNDSLSKEAFKYLEKLKSTSEDINNRIYYVKHRKNIA